MPLDRDNRFPTAPTGKYRGHERSRLFGLAPDPELTEIGPGTGCGEYLRRYWQPIALTSMVGELPLRLRRMGEDLVLFRDRRPPTATLADEPVVAVFFRHSCFCECFVLVCCWALLQYFHQPQLVDWSLVWSATESRLVSD